MPRQLPARPNLEQLKKQAKSLLHAAQTRDAESLRRFAALPSLANKSTRSTSRADLALHDAQSVIAREHGFAVLDGTTRRSRSTDPDVRRQPSRNSSGAPPAARRDARTGFSPCIPTWRRPRCRQRWFSAMPRWWKRDCATIRRSRPQPGGPQNWEPLLYVCHTCLHFNVPSRVEGLVAIARRLCALGANPNAEYHWNWHPELPRTALWGAICAIRHLPLAEVVLEAGANPTDGVSMHIAGGGGNSRRSTCCTGTAST